MAEKRRLGPALSSRAHAFSVEALIGVSARKRRRDGGGGSNENGEEDDDEEEEEEEGEEEEEEGGYEAEGDEEQEDERGKSAALEKTRGVAERASGGEERQRAATSLDLQSASGSDPVSPPVAPADRDDPVDAARAPATPAAPPTGIVPGLGPSQGAPPPPPPPSDLAGVRVELQGSELWQRFHSIGTEMIITKAGRRMFPAIRVKVSGLMPHQHYHLAMDIVPLDNKRYRYVYHSSKWIVAGNADAATPSRLYLHPDSPASGDTWARGVVSFDRAKLTNNELDESGHIILHSMHRYLPRVHVVRKEAGGAHAVPCPTADNSRAFSFPETVFTTVTAYQNQQITRLKIDRNPFAKGFRESGRNRTGLEALMDSYTLWRPPGRALSLEEAAAGGRLHATQASLLDASLMASGFGAAPPPGHHHHHHMFLPTMGPVHMAGSPHPHAHHHHHHHAAAAAAAAAQHHHHQQQQQQQQQQHQQQQQQQQQHQALLAAHHHHHHHHAHQHGPSHGEQQPRFSSLASCCAAGAGVGGGGSVGGQTAAAAAAAAGGCTDSFASALALHGSRAGLQHLGLPRLGLACSISRKDVAQADDGAPMSSFQPALPCLMAQHAAHGAALKDFCSFFP
ncbi:LOW QUALITY PROTEIN: T-box transcription factor TBX18-like [Lampetra planeri]